MKGLRRDLADDVSDRDASDEIPDNEGIETSRPAG